MHWEVEFVGHDEIGWIGILGGEKGSLDSDRGIHKVITVHDLDYDAA